MLASWLSPYSHLPAQHQWAHLQRVLHQVFFGGFSQPSLCSCLPLPPGEVTRRVLRGVSREAVSLQPGSKQHEGLVGVLGSKHEDLAHLTEAMDTEHMTWD